MMALRELDYQQRVLKLLDDYLDELAEQKQKADKKAAANAKETDPDLKHELGDFSTKTWEALREKDLLPSSRTAIPYSPRKDGIDRSVPNIVYKVPTGGGKTFLAVASLSRIFHKYLGKHTGFVLWIVPNEAIYTQTKRQLTDRRHAYRQLLDNLSANAVKIMEKDTPLNKLDVEQNLCVMLLMLQSGNRENKDTLKIFRDRGDVHGFTPPESNQQAHRKVKEEISNLDICNLADAHYPWMPVRDSLGNALRVIRPVVVMDEGHKATSGLAFKTLYGFNPSFVLELTATPKDVTARGGANPRPARYQNLLVEVSGMELDREGMIKMPLNLDSRQTNDWQVTLKAALDSLNNLCERAQTFSANNNRHIRPIMLVQVERTGKEQRDGTHIHAEDVKKWLTSVGQLDEDEVAIKTADQNDLKSPENQALLSESNRIRAIITKQALQEGWDCPFAYVLCSLSASSNQAAMTQMVGRILRQPYAEKTHVKALDECYVITHRAETGKVIQNIKKALESSGMGDLTQSIRVDDANDGDDKPREIKRSSKFRETPIFLPKVLSVLDGEHRELDYETDILCGLDWHNLKDHELDTLVEEIPKNYQAAQRQLHKILLEGNHGGKPDSEYIDSPQEKNRFDCVYTTRFISDIIPNAWLAHEVVKKVVSGLEKRGFSSRDMGRLSGIVSEKLRMWASRKRNQLAERLFRSKVESGCIQFHLQTIGKIEDTNWEMPFTYHADQPENARQLLSSKGGPLQRSLFSPLYVDDLNEAERNIAIYMDDAKAIDWWHRNVAQKHYSLQGWRKEKIYPDFICSVTTDGHGKSKLIVLEMKGEHLAGNEDTEYKAAILKLLTEAAGSATMRRVGEMKLRLDTHIDIHCDLVLFSEWEQRLPDLLQ